MQVQILDSESKLRETAGAWSALVDSLPSAVPFQLPLWLLTWWKHFGSGELQVLTGYEGSSLVAVIPMFRHEWEGRKQLTLIGSGLSDWTDPAIAADVLPAIEKYLDNDTQWDVLDWQDLSADTPLRALAEVTVQDDVPCLVTPLTGSFDEFWNSRSKELRRNVRRYGQRAREMGRVDFEVSHEAQPELLDELIRLHGARWQKQGETGMIEANRAQPFLRDVAEQFAANGTLRIFAVRFEGAVAALVLTVLYRGEIFAYMSAFDPEHESLGFGRTLLYESFRHCFEKGYSAWNFLRGTEPYKSSWGAVALPKVRLHKERASLQPE